MPLSINNFNYSKPIIQKAVIAKRLLKEESIIPNDKNDFEAMKEKLNKKKAKIQQLKQNITNLNAKLVNCNNNTSPNEAKLLTRIKDLESDKQTLEHRLNELTVMKSKEIQSMNETIKQFELVINESSSSNLNEISQLNTQVNTYRTKLDESYSYIKEITQFINRMNDLISSKSKGEIGDIVDLKNKLTEIENYIILTNNNACSYKDKYDKLLEINSKIIEGKGSIEEEYCDHNESNSKKLPYDNSNNNDTQLKMPLFQNKFLEGLSNISSNCYNDNKDKEDDITKSNVEFDYSNNNSYCNAKIKRDNSGTQIYKTLENRVNALERELNEKMYSNEDNNCVTPKIAIKRCLSNNKVPHKKVKKNNTNNTTHNESYLHNNQSKLTSQRKNNSNNNNANRTISSIDQQPSNKKKTKKMKKKETSNKKTIVIYH